MCTRLPCLIAGSHLGIHYSVPEAPAQLLNMKLYYLNQLSSDLTHWSTGFLCGVVLSSNVQPCGASFFHCNWCNWNSFSPMPMRLLFSILPLKKHNFSQLFGGNMGYLSVKDENFPRAQEVFRGKLWRFDCCLSQFIVEKTDFLSSWA